jgi:hypothetical protein
LSSHDSLPVFARLAVELHQEPDEVSVSRAVVTRVREVVPDADKVGLSTRESRGRHRHLAASHPLAERADAMQHALGEGPGVEVAEEGGWVRVGDVATDVRWSSWAPRVLELGIRSVLAVEMGDRLGALTLYSTMPGCFAEREVVDRALAYAAHASVALSCARQSSSLEAAVGSRHVIGMAQGIAMERFGLDQGQSFELLRRLSSTTNVKLRDVAAQIVETRVIPLDLPHEETDEE